MSQQTGSMPQSKSTTDRLTNEAQDKSKEVVDKAKDTAMNTMESQKSRAANNIGNVAEALRQTGKQLRNQDQQGFSRMADTAADRLEQFSDDLQNKDFNEMMDDVEDFARRDPELFLGGAVVLGLLAARFLKSSNRRRYRQPGFQESTWSTYERRGYAERGPVGYPSGEGYRQGFSRPYGERGSGDYVPGSTATNLPSTTKPSTESTTQRQTGASIYQAPPRKDSE
jgi:hypothetical protein